MENDLIVMSLVIFLPTLFALVVLFIPRGNEEGMRWVSLFGTAATLVVSLWLFIDYLKLFDNQLADPQASLLSARADSANSRSNAIDPPNSRDLIARVPWIP